MEFLFLNSIEGDEVEKLFWWNGALFQNPGALYQAVTRQVEGTIQSGIVTGTRIENEGYVLNENIVKNNIDNVISSKFSSLISNYNALNTTSGAKVNTLFAPEETTLYPKLNLRDANSISRFATKITWNPNFITLGDIKNKNINTFRIPITG
jgi:hypothetical protein